MGSVAVRSEAEGEFQKKKKKKETFATNCVFLSAEGCSEGIEGAGREERGKRGEAGRVGSEGGGEREKKPSAKPSS